MAHLDLEQQNALIIIVERVIRNFPGSRMAGMAEEYRLLEGLKADTFDERTLDDIQNALDGINESHDTEHGLSAEQLADIKYKVQNYDHSPYNEYIRELVEEALGIESDGDSDA